MTTQAGAFLLGEGNRWLKRNRDKIINPKTVENDRILSAIRARHISPTSVLEIGCSNGWRLNAITGMFQGTQCRGLEPSKDACVDALRLYGGNRDMLVEQGVSHALKYPNKEFDLVIYGFCLYLSDPSNLLQIASEGDRVLQEHGHIAILDFSPDYSYSRIYEHDQLLRSYKMDWPSLWLGSPTYRTVYSSTFGEDDECTRVTIIQKNTVDAFPLRD